MDDVYREKIETIRNNKRVRQQLAFRDPFWFCLLYLPHHFNHSLAPFHLEMFHIIRQTEKNFITVMAFRESGKSTILNLANVLWSILGQPQKKFAIIMSKTQEQAKNHFSNIKYELESNELLREDFGPFTEHEGMWNKLSLELEYHGSKIMSLTRDQAVRGLKYNQHRPDLIICDDLEDTASVKDENESNMLYERFQSEIIPLGNENTRIIILGNLLSFFWEDPEHDRSLLLKLRTKILHKDIDGIFRAYPLIDNNGESLWPSRFDHETIKKMRSKMSRSTWVLEYLMKSFGQNNEDAPNVLFGSQGAYMKKIYTDHGFFVPEYGEIGIHAWQRPLIEQMQTYDIRVPVHSIAFALKADDPQYREYLEKMHFFATNEELGERIEEDIRRSIR